MSEEFTQGLLRHVVGKICQPLGWHAMNSNAADVLADVTRQYILTIGRTTSAYSCHDNRTEPNLVDLSQAFTDIGVSLPELTDYMGQVRSTPLDQKVPLYPIQQSSSHIHDGEHSVVHRKKACRHGSVSSNQSSEESGDESIPPHLPPLPLLQDNTTHKEEDVDDTESGVDAASEDHSDTEPMDTAHILHPFHTSHDTSRGLPQPQSRPRIFSSDVSEDSGSRRSSISDGNLLREGAFIRTSDTKSGGGVSNVFESAFKQELVKSESSKVELPQKPTVTKGPKLRKLSLNVENIMPSQQFSPLVSKIDSVPTMESPPPIVPTHVTSPPQAQLYQVPQSPQRLPLKDFHVSTEKISISLVRSSLSPPAHDTVERSEVTAEMSPKVIAERSPEVVRNPTPIESPPQTSEEIISPQPSPEEVQDEMEVLEEAEIINRSKEEVVGLEEVLSRLSETESSEGEEIEKKEIEEQPIVEYRDSSIVSTPSPPSSPVSRPLTPSPLPSPVSRPLTPSPLPSPVSRPLTPSPLPSPVSRPLTPSPPTSPVSRPLTPSSHHLSPIHAHSYPPPQDVELSEDNLSISDEGSNSDLDTKPPTEQADSEVEVQQEMLDYSSDTHTKGDTDFEEQVLKSPVSSKIKANEEIIEQITKIEPVSLPAAFDGQMSIEIGGSKDDSSEMIHTRSAQVSDDYLETTKVLELELSTDDDESGDEVPVFRGEESQGEEDASACLLTTSTERVKGETKGRRRTVSKEDVLGISKPKKVSRKRSKKSRAKPQKPAEPPAVSSLMVSIKKTLLPPPVKPLPLTPPTPPPHTTSVPLQITINRRLLRHTKFRLAPTTPEEKPKKSFEMLKIRLAKFGSLSTSTPKSATQTDFDTTPVSAQTTPLGSRKRELEISPSDETYAKRSRLEPQVVTTPLSSSSSSSSSDNEDSSSNPPTPTHTTPSRPTPSHTTPSRPTPSHHLPSHHLPSHTTPSRPTPSHLLPSHTTPSLVPTRALSSDDDSSSSSSSSSDSVSGVSGVSGVGGGGGLKLTISKAVLQQAGGSLPRGGPSPWPSGGKPAVHKSRKLQATLAAKKRKQGSKKQSREAPPLLFSVPAVPRPPPTLPRPPPVITPSLGSDTICPVCNLKDDGSPMIGCDGCDDWCHWRCVGVVVAPPENEKWYCPGCREKAIKKKKKKLKKTKR